MNVFRFINNLKIRSKLALFILLPILTALFFTLSGIFNKYEELERDQHLKHFIDLTYVLSDFVFELQKERGFSAGYVGSKGQRFKVRLSRQREKVDQQLKLLEVSIKTSIHHQYWDLEPEFEDVLSELTYLTDVRAGVDGLKNGDSFEYFNEINANCTRIIEEMQLLTKDIQLAHLGDIYASLNWLRERYGQERGLLNSVFSSQKITTQTFQQLSFYIAFQQSLLTDITAIATEEQKLLFNKHNQHVVAKEVEQIRETIIIKAEKIDLLNSLNGLIGYGGLIHNFKNYLLRGDEVYFKSFKKIILDSRNIINKFKKIKNLSQKEHASLVVIENTLSLYDENIDGISKLKQSGYSIQEIDRLVKVNDEPAIEAISQLQASSNILVNNEWWDIATLNIRLLENIIEHVEQDITKRVDLLISQSVRQLIVYGLTAAFVVMVSLLFGYFLVKRFVYDIQSISETMNQMRDNDNYNQITSITGKDEIGKMADIFNSMIIERKFSESKLRLASAVFEHSPEAIMVTDSSNNIAMINPAFVRITGYREDEVLGKNPSILQSHRHEKSFYRKMWRRLLRDNSWEGEVWSQRKNGEVFPEWLSINVVRNEHHEVTHYIGMFRDVTQRKAYEENIWRQANFDTLTGLPNRKMFMERLSYEIERAGRANTMVAVLFVDLDRFKLINDTMGHGAGDLLLQEASRRLQNCIRKSDTVARLGGDEFVVIVTDIREDFSIDHIVDKLLAELARSFDVGADTDAFVSGSIGITLYPNDGSDVETLLKNADTAMYRAKDSGKNTFAYFTEEMNEKVKKHMHMEHELRKAYERDEFKLYYQPIVDLETLNVIGAEALIRWESPVMGLVYPKEFISVAEETGLIVPLGGWVLEQAVKQAEIWNEELGDEFSISINISSRQCFGHGKVLTQLVKETINNSNIDGNKIKLEITESLLMDGTDEMIDALQSIRDLGIEIYLDDFGTGYSSLGYLQKFPIDGIKIDHTFMKNVVNDENAAKLVESVVLLGRSLNLKVIGEGIETPEHFEYAKTIACKYLQGYYFSVPLPAHEFKQYMKEIKDLSVPVNKNVKAEV